MTYERPSILRLYIRAAFIGLLLVCAFPVVVRAENVAPVITPSTLYNATAVSCIDGSNDGDTGVNIYTPSGVILTGGWGAQDCTAQLTGYSLYTGADFGIYEYGDWHMIMFYGDDIACNNTDYDTCVNSGDPLSNQTITVIDTDAPTTTPPYVPPDASRVIRFEAFQAVSFTIAGSLFLYFFISASAWFFGQLKVKRPTRR